jgi:hypothetical protein
VLSTPRPWYAKGVFETDENLDPRKATTGYAVLVSLLAYCQRVPWALSALADKPLTHCVRWCARARGAADRPDEDLVAAAERHRAGRGNEGLAGARGGDVRAPRPRAQRTLRDLSEARVRRHRRHDEEAACSMMSQFAKAFAEPQVAAYTFRVEVHGDDSAVLTLEIDTSLDADPFDDDDFDEQTTMKWSFSAAALEWAESAKLLRDTFIQPLISVKQQLQMQKMDLAEHIANDEQGGAPGGGAGGGGGGGRGGGGGGGGQMRAVTNWRAAYNTNGTTAGGPEEFKLELFDKYRVEVRTVPCCAVGSSSRARARTLLILPWRDG